MICPDCKRVINEEERYLMSRDRDAEPPSWWPYAAGFLLFLVMVGAFQIASRIGS